MKAVLVTTIHRGVFFGYQESLDGDCIVLTKCRNCLRWERGGFLALAKTGPDKDCRIGDEAERVQLFGVTSIADCSEEAVKAWS